MSSDGYNAGMSFCDHCEGQRFDRARVLRALRKVQRGLRAGDRCQAEEALARAVWAVKNLEIPHLEVVDFDEHEIVH